jgi:fatty acid desaturase
MHPLHSDASWASGTSARRPTHLVPREVLQPLQRRKNRPGLIFLGAHLGLLGGTGTIVYLTSAPLWGLGALFLHGVVLVHLFAPFHEATHATAFEDRRLNQGVAWFTGLVIMIPPRYFTLEHAAHHTYTQHPESDPESIPQATTFRGYWHYVTAIPYFHGVLKNLTHHPRGHFSTLEQSFIPERLRREVQQEAQWMLGAYLLLLIGSVWVGSAFLFWYWLLPRILGEPVMRLVRISEHGGCPWVADLLRNTRTTLTWRPVRWLAWNMPFHAEHHAFPNVPFHALPELHRHLGPHIEHVDDGYVLSHLRLQQELYRQVHSQTS